MTYHGNVRLNSAKIMTTRSTSHADMIHSKLAACDFRVVIAHCLQHVLNVVILMMEARASLIQFPKSQN